MIHFFIRVWPRNCIAFPLFNCRVTSRRICYRIFQASLSNKRRTFGCTHWNKCAVFYHSVFENTFQYNFLPYRDQSIDFQSKSEKIVGKNQGNFVECNFARVTFPEGRGAIIPEGWFPEKFPEGNFAGKQFPSTFCLKGAEQTTFY